MIKQKIKCFKCRNIAVWVYAPRGNSPGDYYCDDCVSRGCSCNLIHFEEDEGYELLSDDQKSEELKDNSGRLLPCCEFWYDKEGFDIKDLEED